MTTLLPVLAAVLATAGYGWWAKTQPQYRGDFRRRNVPISEYPKVSLKLAGFGSGNPTDKRFRRVSPAGAWMWFEVFDDREPRGFQGRRVLAVSFSATDEAGTAWSLESTFQPGGLLVTVPKGYTRAPGVLQVQAKAAGSVIGVWKMPTLEPPRRVLSKTDALPKGDLKVLKPGPKTQTGLRVEAPHALPSNERWEVELVAHSFHRFDQPEKIVIPPLGRHASFRAPPNGGAEPIGQVELILRKYRAHHVARTFDLSESYVRRIDGQPILQSQPSILAFSEDFTLDLRPVYAPMIDGKTNPTMYVSLSTDTFLSRARAHVIQPSDGATGLKVALLNGLGSRIEITPPPQAIDAPLKEGLEFDEGPFPYRIAVDAWRYRLVEKTHVIVPVAEPAGAK